MAFLLCTIIRMAKCALWAELPVSRVVVTLSTGAGAGGVVLLGKVAAMELLDQGTARLEDGAESLGYTYVYPSIPPRMYAHTQGWLHPQYGWLLAAHCSLHHHTRHLPARLPAIKAPLTAANRRLPTHPSGLVRLRQWSPTPVRPPSSASSVLT